MIRPLIDDDRLAVIAMLRATERFTAAELDIAAELVDVVVATPDQKDYFAFVDELDGRLRGLLILGPVPATQGTWHVYWIAVDPDFYGSGIAQDLDRWATEFVAARHGYWLLAETSGQPGYARTRGFYAKQGYAVLATIPDYYKPGDELVLLGRRL